MPVSPVGTGARWIAPALVATGILVATSWPSPAAMPPGQWDKVIHFSSYAALGAATAWALRPSSWRRVARAWLGVAALGAADEVHQHWIPGRSPDPVDWLADSAGGAVGLALFSARRPRQEPRS